MKRFWIMLGVVSAVSLAAVPVGAELTDPYEILHNHYEALGGLEKLKARSTSHIEGTLVIEGTGLEGTFVEWAEVPVRRRQDIDLGIIKQSSGDNGEYPWVVDQNGKLQIVRDDIRLKSRTVDSLMSGLEHLNRASEYFAVSYEGVDTAAGVACYIVRIENSINDDILLQYYDTTGFLLVRQVSKNPNGEQHSLFSDYRLVGDIMMSFRQEMLILPTGMKQIIQIATAELNIPVDPQLFEPPAADIEDFRFADGRSAEDIPFQFIENHIYLPVEVGGKTRLWVLDTGASVTVIEKKFASELGLTLEGKLKGRGVGNLVDVSFTTLPPFSLPGLEFDSQKVAVIDINWLFTQWIDQEIGGILGYDFLSRMVIKVDYAHEKLSLYHPDHFAYGGPGKVIEAPLSAGNTFLLPVTVEGVYGGNWSLDLGAGGMSFFYPYAVQHKFFDRSGRATLGWGAGGPIENYSALFTSVEFAGFTVGELVFSMPRAEGDGAFSSGELTGNIGNTLLRHFVLYLDYKHQQMAVEKGDDFGRIFPRDNSGLEVIRSNSDNLEVVFVSPGTPADKAGFQIGDVIRSVNGIDAESLGGVVALKKMLRADPGIQYSFVIDRAGKENKLKMTLKDLYE